MMVIENAVPYVAMVIVQLAQVGLMIAAKVAISNGMTTFTFTFYSNVLASLILLPITFFVYRSARPPLFLTFLCGFFLLGFLGFVVQILGYTGLMYSSASLSTTILNLVPGFTFVFAIILRMEKFNYRSSTTLAKTFGTMVTIIGALIVTLYQGPSIWGISPHSNSNTLHTLTSSSAWLLGALLLTIDTIVASIFIIAQALVLKKCPFELILMLFYSCFVAILSAVVALIVEKDFSSWSLKSTTTLIPIIYSALFGNVFQVSVIMWCVRKRGPLFASVFHPLGVIFATAMGVIFLGEALHLGSLLGSVVVVVGFYGVLWGKAKEVNKIEENGVKSLESNEKREPLLLNNTDGNRLPGEPFLTLPFLVQVFFLGLIGITIAQNLAFVGLSYSSPIVACGMANQMSAFSFILAIILRTSNFEWKRSGSQARLIGTIISFGGAISVALYKGPTIRNHPSPPPPPPRFLVFTSTHENWVLGCILFAASSFTLAIWNILQVGIVKMCPQIMKILSFYSLFGAIQSVGVALYYEKDPNAWRLDLNFEFLLIVLTAIFGSVIRSSVQIWCSRLKGPPFVPFFKPCGIAYATTFGTLLFPYTFHYGSIMGAVICGVGYYTVLWGQIKDDEVNKSDGRKKISHVDETERVPLLQPESQIHLM